MQGVRAFHRVLDFSGRSGRAEYWQFVGIMAAAIIAAVVVDFVREPVATRSFSQIVVALMLLPHVAVAMRRLHDRNRSGWWIGAYLIVVAANYLVIILAETVETASAYDGLQIAFGVLLVITIGLALFLLIQFLLPGDDHHNNYGPIDAGAGSGRTEPYQTALIAGAPTSPRTTSAGNAQQSPPQSDPLEQIERLSKLKAAGALTEDEFAAQKATLLKRL